MASVDSRIVTMKFDNAQFKQEASATMTMLDKLKQNMNFSTATSSVSKGLSGISGIFSRFSSINPFAKATVGVADLSQEANRFTLTGMEGAVTGISKSFLAMSTVAITAIANITTAALQSGAQLVKSFTLDPIISGFTEYETTLNSIQTILANTGLKGKAGLDQVNSALTQLNHYSDKTIYNFSEMAKNIGTFTAAGVDLDTSVSAIKGIANLAAISGSSSVQASSAMYQLSQALASGKVSLMDWNSVVNAGMGGKVFQDALVRTATTMGTIDKNAVKTTGPMKMLSIHGKSFRDSISSTSGESWLTSDVLTKTLSQLSGDMTDAQLKAQGFTASQVKAIQEMAKTGVNAATKVKTLTQLMDTLKEAVGSGWSKTFTLVFGNFTEAKGLFTNVSQVLGGMVQQSAKTRNDVLADWKELGGRTVLIDGISNAFHALMDVLKPIGDAFREIFPAKTGQDLYDMTKAFAEFTKGLSISDETADNLKRTFAGVFAVFDIVGQVIGGFLGMLGRLAGAISDGTGGFLDFTGGIGDFLISVDEALKKGGALNSFFDGLGDILAIPLKIIGSLAGAIASLFSGFKIGSADAITGAMDNLKEHLTPLERLASSVGNIFATIGGWIADAASAIVDSLGGIGEAIAGSFTSDTFSHALDVVNTALIGGIVLLLKNFFSNGISKIDLSGGLFDSIKETLGGLTSSLKVMQTDIKADIIQKIAISIGILAVAIVLLASINPKDMAFGMAAMAGSFAILTGALVALTKVITYMGTLKLPFIVLGLMGLATAMLIMAGALKIMASIQFGALVKGLVTTAGALAIFVKALSVISKSSINMLPAAAAILVLSVALNAIAAALKIMATMFWEDIGKGLTTMAGALVIIAGAMRLMPKSLPLTAAGLILVSIAINAIATALKIMATLSWEDIAQGLVALGGALLIIAGAMALMPPSLPLTAAGLVLVGLSLNIIAGAMKIMASMSWEEIAKGLVMLAGTMLILSVAMDSMVAALPGALALIVIAASLAILGPVMVMLGAMSWMGILKSLVALAGALTVLGVAAALLTPVIPSLLGLGAAMVLLGAGLALAGTGALAFATAFGEVVSFGTAGARVLGQMLGTVIKQIPEAMKQFAKGLGEMAKQIIKSGPQFVKAWTSVLGNFLDGITKNAPKMADAFLAMLNAGLKVVENTSPKIARAGLKLITDFLDSINDKLPKLIDIGSDLVTNLLNGIARNNQKVVNAGIKLIIDTINDMANAIDAHSSELGAAGANLGIAIVHGMASGLAGAGSAVVDAAQNVAASALQSAKDFLGIHSPSKEFEKLGHYVVTGFAKGIVGSHSEVTTAMKDMKRRLRAEMQSMKQEVDTQESKLKSLLDVAEKDQNAKLIRRTRARLAAAQEMYDAADHAHTKYMKHLDDEQNHIEKLSKRYDEFSDRIDKAKQKLADAIRTRDDYEKGIVSSYGALPEISGFTTVEDYLGDLAIKTQDNKTFLKSLNQLVAMGLSDKTYKKLLDEGVDAQPFIDELIAAGPKSVKAINKSTKDLATISKHMGASTSTHLYEAGVKSAEGLLKGLQSKRNEIEHMMEKVARSMVKALRKALKIKSPSEEFERIGMYSNQGLAKGLDNYAHLVDRSARGVAKTALKSMKSTIAGLSEQVSGEMKAHPTVSPVLDLSQVRKDAEKMSSILGTKHIKAGMSFHQAESISVARNAVAQRQADDSSTRAHEREREMSYIQYNYSPKALDAVQIYRNTRNQLSLAKEALRK